MEAVWTPWSWSSSTTAGISPPSSRPQSAPAPATNSSALPSQPKRRPRSNVGRLSSTFPLAQKEDMLIGSRVWHCGNGSKRIGGAVQRAAAGATIQAAASDFRRLGPSGCSSTKLTGCEGTDIRVKDNFPALGTGCSSGFRHRRKSEACPNGGDPRHDSGLTDGVTRQMSNLMTPISSAGTSPRSRSGVGSGRDTSISVLCTTSPSRFTQSPSSKTGTSIAETPWVWNYQDLAAAELAVRARPHRMRFCRAFRTRESSSAGMTAAQRAHRGAYIVNKMGDARVRTTWRPYGSMATTLR